MAARSARADGVEMVPADGLSCPRRGSARAPPAARCSTCTAVGMRSGGTTVTPRWRTHIAGALRVRRAPARLRLAPEHHFPTAVDDIVAAYRWLLDAGVDPSNTVVVGGCAGGGLTVATLLRLRDEGSSLPAAAVVISTWADLELSEDSVREGADDDPMVDDVSLPWMRDLNLAGADLRDRWPPPATATCTACPPFRSGSAITRSSARTCADSRSWSGAREGTSSSRSGREWSTSGASSRA